MAPTLRRPAPPAGAHAASRRHTSSLGSTSASPSPRLRSLEAAIATTRTPRPLTSSLDAVEVILTLLDDEPGTTLAALLDHLPGPNQLVVPVSGGDPDPAGAAGLAGLLAGALPAGSRARLVLASVRTTAAMRRPKPIWRRGGCSSARRRGGRWSCSTGSW